MDEKAKFNLIEKYLQGEFSEEEKKAIEQKIAEDPELWAESNLHLRLHQFLQNQEELKLREQLKALEEATRKRKSNPLLTYGIAATVSLLALAGLFFWYTQQQIVTEEIFAARFEPYPMVLSQRNESRGNQDLQSAVNAYLAQDYHEAIIYFDELIEKDTLVTLAQFYQGVSYLALNQPLQSIEKLSAVKDSDQSLLQQQALWYSGLAYLLNKDRDLALSTFKKLADYNDYKQEEVKKIIEKLE